MRQCFPSKIGEELEVEVNRARESGQPMYSERRIPFARGARWMSAWLSPFEDGHGGTGSVMGVARDVTQRHDLGELLTRQHQLLNRLVDASPVGIMLVTYAGRWICEFSNPVVQHLARRATLDGLPLDEAWPDLASAIDPLLVTVRKNDRREPAEISLSANGSTRGTVARHLSVTASRVKPSDRTELSVLLLIDDITDRRHLEQQLLHADKMDAIGRLAGGIAHDFNNLLTPILGYAELALATLTDDDARRKDLEEIVAAAKSAGALTRQLLAFGRKEPARLDVVELNTVIRSVEGIVRRTIGEDVTVIFQLDERPCETLADRNQIEQIVMNLCVNARDAMPAGGTLTIRTAEVVVDDHAHDAPAAVPRGNYVALQITDSGTGMPSDVRARIFEPFFTTKSEGKGTGLGLSIVHGIVEQAGGHIDVASAPGEGTSFTIFFPKTTSSAHSAVLTPAPGPTRGRGETVLIVEDNDALRRLAERQLRSEGYVPLVAQNADVAIELAQSFDGPIHLLLSDIVMPGIDGVTLACQIVRQRPDTHVLFMSGYTGHDMATHGLLSGDLPLLQKPFTCDILARAVHHAINRPWDGDMMRALAPMADVASQGWAPAESSEGHVESLSR